MIREVQAKIKQDIDDEATRHQFFNEVATVHYFNAQQARVELEHLVNNAISSIKRLGINQTFDNLLLVTEQRVGGCLAQISITLSTNITPCSIGTLADIAARARYFEMDKHTDVITSKQPRYTVNVLSDDHVNLIRTAWQEKLNA